MSATAERVVTVKLGEPQAAIMEASARFLDVEGAFRSAKTWTCLMKLRRDVEDYPGIRIAISRWTEDGLKQKLIPDYRNVCNLMGLFVGQWNASESCYEFPRPGVPQAQWSRIYAVHLKAGQTDNRYSKVRGLTVAKFYIDQLEEVPEDVYDEAALRLSQPGFPQQMIVSPNPVPESHWIAKRWKTAEQGPLPDHAYLHLSVWDNAHNLSPETIAAAERLYPVGHPARLAKLEGRRGPDIKGKPVYAGVFDRRRHAPQAGVPLNPALPLCELYDYGFHHPCVVWLQWAPWGQVRVLGGVMGEDLHLPRFLPMVQRYRDKWFAGRKVLMAGGDPAGGSQNSQGLEGTPVEMINDWYQQHGDPTVRISYLPDANHPERRVGAVQTAATYMTEQTFNGEPAFVVDPERWALVSATEEKFEDFFLVGLEVGYVLEDEPRHSTRLGTIWVPMKDGYYEHGQNCFEYGVQQFVRGVPVGAEKQPERHKQHLLHASLRQAIEARLALKKAQQDVHPEDAPRRGGRMHLKGPRRMVY